MFNILITGCSKGFGLLFAKYLADKNFKVFATARDLNNAPELLALKEKFDNIHILELDVVNPLHIKQITELMSIEKIDILINNAGYGLMGKFADLEPSELLRQFEINTFVPIELTRQLLPFFNSKGLVINISSIASYLGLPSFGAYSASKVALNSLSMSLACENPHLSVVVIQPGPYNTKFRDSVKHVGDTTNYQQLRSRLFKTQEDSLEVAELVYKLISEKSKLPIYSEIPIGSNSNLFRLLSRWLPLNWIIQFMSSQSSPKE